MNTINKVMSDIKSPKKYTGVAPGTEDFRMKSLTPDEKQLCLDKVNLILDRLDDIQGLLGQIEYTKQLCHWEGILNAIKNEY
jgi:hypothetical protein